MVDNVDGMKTVINCEPTIDISSAQTLFEHLNNAVSGKHDVEINAGDVTRVDTAVLQVFTAFMLESKNQEHKVTWNEVSEAFYASADLLGLVEDLNLPVRE